jgi:hypothetical protein
MKWLLAWLIFNALVLVWRSLVVLPQVKTAAAFSRPPSETEMAPALHLPGPSSPWILSLDTILEIKPFRSPGERKGRKALQAAESAKGPPAAASF